MKLTAKEAYLLMKEGRLCVGDGMVYRIKGMVNEFSQHFKGWAI